MASDEPIKDSGKRDWTKTLAVIGPLIGIVVGAFVMPLGQRIVAEKPETPVIPGAPEEDLPEGTVTEFGYTYRSEVEVSNITSDPIHGYFPLNARDTLPVRPDRIDARFVVRVEVKRSTYLTVSWSCTAFTPKDKVLGHLARAILRVDP